MSISVLWKDFSEAQSIVCEACIVKEKDNKTVCATCPVYKTIGSYYKEIDADMIMNGLLQHVLYYRMSSDKVWLLFGFQYLEAPLVPRKLPDITELDKISRVVCSVMPVICNMYKQHNENPTYMGLLRYLLVNLKEKEEE